MSDNDLIIAESWLRLVLSFAAPPLLVVLAVVLFAGDVAVWIPIVVGSVGILLTVFVVFDFATKVIIGTEGIARKAPLRTATLPWDDIDRLVAPKRGGLTAVAKDGRHVILVDRKLANHEIEGARSRAREAGVQLEILTRRTRLGA